MFWKNIGTRVLRTSLGLGFVGIVLTVMSACAPTLPGTITFVKAVLETSVVAISLYDNKWVYAIDENGKLISYDMSNPEKPKKGSQVDAFKDKSYHMAYERSSQWLVVVGESKKIGIYDIRDPESPTPIWGNGKFFKLKKFGPLMIRPDSPTMYMTPGGGTALVRVDLAALSSTTIDQGAVDAATTMVSGGGGGGIVMPFSSDGAAIRVYVGNKTSGKIDAWNITKIEEGFKADKPVNANAIKAGTSITNLFVYQKSASANQRWLVAVSDTGDLEYLDLGKNDKFADEPKSIGTASVPGFIAISNDKKVIVGEQLAVWDFSAEFSKPVEFAKPDIRADFVLRTVIVHKDYVLTAEASGFNVYKYAKATN